MDSMSGKRVLYVLMEKKKLPTQPIAKLNVPGIRRTFPKNRPVSILSQRQGNYTQNSFFFHKNFSERKR